MAIMGFNPAAEMSQMRTQTLAMQATSSAAPAAAATAAADPAAAAAAAAAAPGAAADAAIGAQAVQPPQTSKIVMQSVLKGAMTGVSVSLGLKQFGPMLAGIGFLKPVAAFISKLPVVSHLIPLFSKGPFGGFLVAGLIGAGVGAIFGAVSGLKKAKAAAAEYAEAMAAQQAQAPAPTPAAPAPTPADSAPAPAPARTVRRAKSWIISRSGATSRTGGSIGHYTTRKGDTIEQLAERFHTSAAEIRKLNPGLGSSLSGSSVAPGTTLKLKRKVVPNAKAWVA
jgi:LysM repeat protein